MYLDTFVQQKTSFPNLKQVEVEFVCAKQIFVVLKRLCIKE